MKYIRNFLLSATLVLFVIIEAGTIQRFSGISYGESAYHSTEFVIALSVGIFFVFFLAAAFRLSGTISPDKQKYLSLLYWGIFFAFSLFLILSIDYRPDTDSLTDIDMGWYLRDYRLTDDNKHIYWIRIFGNNYLLILIFKWLAVLAHFLRIGNTIRYLLLFNLFCVALGVFLTWKIVLLEKGITRANKVLLLIILNPLIYYLIFWVYSSSVSVPVMMGILYLAVCLYNNASFRKKILSGTLLGLLTCVGWFIRPTAVFPLMAYIVYILLSDIKRCRERNFWIAVAFTAAAMILSFIIVNHVINNTFEKQREGNFPLTRWTYIGSMGEGEIRDVWEMDSSAIAEADSSGKSLKEVFLEGTIENYRKMGIAGTANLWVRKTMTTYSDAFSQVVNRTFHGTYRGAFLELLKGDFGRTYAYLYRMALYLGIIICILLFGRSGEKDVLTDLMVLIMLGGIVFNFIWECKGDYALVYLLSMAVLSAEGFDRADSFMREHSLPLCHIRFEAVLLLILFITLNGWTILSQSSVTDHNRIDGDNRHRGNEHTELRLHVDQDDSVIVQTFACGDKFNKIAIQTGIGEENSSTNEDESTYEINIFDSSKEQKFDTVVSAGDVTDNQIILKTGTLHSKDGQYRIVIRKISKGKKDLIFYTTPDYYIDSYKGRMTFEGKQYVDDLSMTVNYEVHAPMSRARRTAVIAAADLVVMAGWIGLRLIGAPLRPVLNGTH